MSRKKELTSLVRRLESIAALSASQRDALLSLSHSQREVKAGNDIVCEHDRPTFCCLMLEGMSARYKITESGGRQIMSFHIAGEIPDVQSLFLHTMDHSLGAITDCGLAVIDHQAMLALFDEQPRLARVFWRESLIDASIFREWMLGLGRRPAPARMAHLLCELYARHEAVGLVADTSFEFRLTQSELGDALGLSTVHVNRTLQDLRSRGLIGEHGPRMKILDLEELRREGGFDPTYLHQEPV